MIKLTVLYPNTENSHFDMDYYLQKHTPLVKDRLTPLGLTNVELSAGVAGMAPGAAAPYAMITNLCFNSMEGLQQSLMTHGAELIADIANFTNVQAEMLITQPVESAEKTPIMASVN
jgi:uncharacterized protein (TIGR02118 family)